MRNGPTTLAIDIAERVLESWLAEPARSAAVLRHTAGSSKPVSEHVLVRVREVLAHELPWAANRRWACESIRAWAPLAALLDPQPDGIEHHRDMLVEFDYGHLLAETGSVADTCEMLRIDLERLALEIDVATDLADALEPGVQNASGWVREYRAMSLTLADYLHRCTVDIPSSLPDALAHHYANEVARIQREVRDQCIAARSISTGAHTALVATGA
jgi:hypothetical protein